MKKLKERYGFLSFGLILISAGAGLGALMEKFEVLKLICYLAYGAGICLMMVGINRITGKRFEKKHPEMAMENEILRNDERNRMLSDMAKGKGFDLMTYVFLAQIIAFYFMKVSPAVLIVMAAAWIFMQVYVVVCHTKLSKKM